MKKYQKTIFLLLLLIIPINLYKINFDLGSGIQFILFKFQDTIYTTNFFMLNQELSFVISQQINGRSAWSIVLWVMGSVLILTAILSDFIESILYDWNNRRQKSQAVLIILAVPLFLGSCVAQYGPALSGPAGYCIPLGVPLLIATGCWFWKDADEPIENEDDGIDKKQGDNAI